ncbi:MAG: CDGSH iron-sulfur domain-containing protein [Bdellovibrionota bacterium]
MLLSISDKPLGELDVRRKLPKIADTKPAVLEMEAGDYFWCACGLSAKQPFCDGSHKGTGCTPIKVTLDAARKFAWCTCKQSAKGHQCDGTHKSLCDK